MSVCVRGWGLAKCRFYNIFDNFLHPTEPKIHGYGYRVTYLELGNRIPCHANGPATAWDSGIWI